MLSTAQLLQLLHLVTDRAYVAAELAFDTSVYNDS